MAGREQSSVCVISAHNLHGAHVEAPQEQLQRHDEPKDGAVHVR